MLEKPRNHTPWPSARYGIALHCAPSSLSSLRHSASRALSLMRPRTCVSAPTPCTASVAYARLVSMSHTTRDRECKHSAIHTLRRCNYAVCSCVFVCSFYSCGESIRWPCCICNTHTHTHTHMTRNAPFKGNYPRADGPAVACNL